MSTLPLPALRRVLWLLLTLATGMLPAQTLPGTDHPLTPDQVAVVASLHAPDSVEIAREYIQRRHIPPRQLLITGMPLGEKISRRDYEQYIATPVRDFLVKDHLDQVRCIVLIYGVPLKIEEPETLPDDKRMEQRLRDEREAAINDAIQLLKRSQAIARPGLPSAAIPEVDAKASARRQLNDLGRLILNNLSVVRDRLKTLSGPARDSLQSQFNSLIRDAFGDDALGAWQQLELPPPPPPADLPARRAELEQLAAKPLNPTAVPRLLQLLRSVRGTFGLANGLDALLARAHPDWTWRAAVDSELAALCWPAYPLTRYQRNPLNMHVPPGTKGPKTLMVCRLDGPDAATVRRMLSDSLAAEAHGLTGKLYVDARGFGRGNAYGNYDVSLQKFARLAQDRTTLSVTLENTGKMFQPGACPNAALYCGWYSLGKYIPAFTWAPGAVAWHIASDEARTLKKAGAQNWCPSLLRAGAAATLGPVEEPYLTAFPPPSEFFGLLLTGRFTLAECYWKTVPHVSWMMTLIGDPLYNPFKAHPPLDLADFLDTLQGATEP